MSNWVEETVKAAGPGLVRVVYWTGEVEFLAAAENDTTGRTVKLRVVRGPEEQHLINPFAKATRRRRGFAGTHFQMSMAGIGADERLEYCNTVVMLGWSDGPAGATVTVKLPDDEREHPFMFCRRPSAEVGGTRWMTVFIEIGDGEVAVNQLQADQAEAIERTTGIVAAMRGDFKGFPGVDEKPHQTHGQSHAQSVGILIKSQPFLDFLREMVDADTNWTPAIADTWLKMKLKIASKTELNHSFRARADWEALRSHYLEWAARGHRLPRD